MPYSIPGKSIASHVPGSHTCPHCGRIYHTVNIRLDTKNKVQIKSCPLCGFQLGQNKSQVSYEELSRPNEEAWGIGIFENKIKPISLTKDGQYQFLDNCTWLHHIIYTATKEALILHSAIEELEYLLNQAKIKETTLQDFFERNPALLLGYDYRKAHPHINLVRADGPLIPDFMLEPIGQEELCDILDLKLPTEKIYIEQKNRERYSATVLEACAQLREYNNYFDQESNRKLIYKTYGLKAYKPKMVVVIGRKSNLDPLVTRRIETDIPQLVLKTYDDILVRAKTKLEHC
jgi:predicted RNA-binding Zn-ribbon protein involved in translation (DUF1610 family)